MNSNWAFKQGDEDITEEETFYLVIPQTVLHYTAITSAVVEAKTEEYFIDHDENSVLFDEDSYTEPPAVFAEAVTYEGSNTAYAKVYNVDANGFDCFLEEEQSDNAETDHGSKETLNVLVMEEGYIRNYDGTIIGEVGSVTFQQASADSWYTVMASRSYVDPVVIMRTNTLNDSDPAHIRLDNIQSDGFDYKLEEWDYLDGARTQDETAVYMILEKGQHWLPDEKYLTAQTINCEDDNWVTGDFDRYYFSTPVVLTQVQTYNGVDSVITRVKDLSSQEFSVKLQEQESKNQNHNEETVAVVSYV